MHTQHTQLKGAQGALHRKADVHYYNKDVTRDAGGGGSKIWWQPVGCLHHSFSCVESKLFLKVKHLCARLALASLCMAHRLLTACVRCRALPRACCAAPGTNTRTTP